MKIRAELAISAPAQDAWMVVGERFGEIGEWASAIAKSVMDGPPGSGQARTCHVRGFGPIAPGVIRERLVRFDPGNQVTELRGGRGDALVHRARRRRWSVHERPGGTCLVRIDATVTLRPIARPLGPVLRWRMRADTRRTLAELRHRVETGRPHPAKLATLTGEDALP